MRNSVQKLLALLLTTPVFLSNLLAQDRFPRPEFDSDYTKPLITTPLPQNAVYEYLDVLILFLALSLASYLVLKRRSRNMIFLLSMFSLVYFGFWREGCICPIGSVQNITLAIFDATYLIPLSVLIFFILPLLFALFFGRTFCAGVCPLGAIQELVLVKPTKVPPKLAAALGLIPYAFLGAAILYVATGAGFIVCRLDPFVGFFRFGGEFKMILFGLLFLGFGLFYGRPYCRFLCPYGVLLGWASKFSKWHHSITPDRCTQCRLCEESCPFDAIDKPVPELSTDDQKQAGTQLGKLIMMTLVMVVIGGVVGSLSSMSFSNLHPRIQLAERVMLESNGLVEGTTLASRTFHESGELKADLLLEVNSIRDKFKVGTILLGIFMGLVIGLKGIGTFFKRSQVDYESNRTDCFSCGRCFPYCPDEHERQKVLDSQKDLYESIG